MEDKKQFKHLMAESECTQRAAEELWKWYDRTEKKEENLARVRNM